MRSDTLVVCVMAVMMSVTVRFVSGLHMILKPQSKRCLSEKLQAKVLVTGEYELEDVPNHYVSYQIIDTKNHILSQKSDSKSGKFSFVTETDDLFEICFQLKVVENDRGRDVSLMLKMKHGVQAKNYDGIAESAKLKPLEVEVTKLSDLTKSIVNTFEYMRKREELMRSTNETTNNRVLYFSLFSMLCLFVLATWQIMYLRRYFKAKKLID